MNLGEILAGGQERRKKLDQTLGETLSYYLGPTGIPQRLAALGVLNPVNDMEQASQKAKTVFSPDATGRARFDAGVGMVTDMATVLAPVAATNRVGGDATAAVVDSLLGIGNTTREGLQDAGRRFAGDEAGNISFGASKADEIARLLREGRAEEITDDMMAALDPNDQMRLFKLYEDGATGMPMPMDEASRMARAREMGFADDAYHATSKDFQSFVPSDFRGASFFGPTPDGAQRGASASANEGVGSGTGIIIPARVNTSGVEGLGAYARRDMNEFRASLPDRLYTEAEMDALMASDAAPLRGNWDDFFEDLTDYDALRAFRDANPDGQIPDGIIKYKPKQPLQYSPDLRRDISGQQFAHYSDGMSERPTSDYVKSQGNTGFTMQDESGLALAVTDPTTIRSRFARFDPRLKHLANLSAGGAAAVPLGALMAGYDQNEEQRKLREYLQQ